MRKDENGTILIEFVGSFLLFFLLIISILSLVNIVTVQARIHYALSETANTMSIYRYASSAANRAHGGGQTILNDIDETFKKLNKFQPGFAAWENSAPAKAYASAKEFYYDDVRRAVLKKEIEQMILYNLSAGGQSGEDYLRSVRVSNLKLTDLVPPGHSEDASGKKSVYLGSTDLVKLTVEYEIDYTFMGLPLPFEPKLKVAQSVMTKVWSQTYGYSG